MGKDLNFALVGCGRIAKRHAELLSGKVKNARLVAVCDIIPERTKQFSEKYKVPGYTDYHKMMESETIDVVNVLTPSGLHAQHVIQLAPYGKSIVVEKPMALTLDSADRMIESCELNQVRLFVVKQNRFNLPVVKLHEALSAGRFGKLVLGTVRVRWCRKQDYYDQDAWRGTWAMDGGVLTNQASHHIDLLEWMFGDVESVFAKTATQLVDIETEDTGAAVLKFKSGALGIVEATTATRPTDLEGSLSILGEKGAVEIGGFATNEMRVWQFDEELPGDKEVMKSCRQSPPDVYGFGHLTYLENVVSCVNGKQKATVDGLEGRKSLELINALYESAETQREVFLRFAPKRCQLGIGAEDWEKTTK